MRTIPFLSPMWSIMVVLVLCTITSVNSYSKYGRGCVDIGCLPNEVCILSHDSCGFGQRDGKECGSYPTCKKSGAAPSNSGGVKPSGASLNPAPDNTIFSPSSNPASHSSNSYNSNGNNNNNYANNNNGGNSGSNGNRNNPNSQIDPHYVFGAPYSQPIIPNMPIFPFNQPTQPPAFQQFPQPNHPGSGLSPAFPHNIQPSNPYNPPFIFGQQPFFNNPGGTGGPPGSLAPGGGSGIGLGGYNNPNMFNKPPPQYLPNQNPYNRQTQSHPSSAAGGVHHGTSRIVVVFSGLLGLSSVSGGLSMVTGFVLGLVMLQQRMGQWLRTASIQDSNGPESVASQSPSHNQGPSSPSAPSYPGGSSNGGGGGGGFNGFSAGGHSLYPTLPNSNPNPNPNPNPYPNPANGGYSPYNPYQGQGQGGYQPGPPNGGYGGYNGGGGYGGGGAGAGGYGGGGNGGYSGGGAGGYQPRPQQPPQKEKGEGGGFFSNFLSNPLVNQAVTGIISGQISKALSGGNGAQGNNGQAGQYAPSGGYGQGGGGSSGTGSSGSGSNFLGGLLGNVLAGAANGGGGGGGGGGSSGSSGLGLLGQFLGGAGGGGGGANHGSSGSGLGEIFSSKNFGGLFNEKPSGSSGSSSPSSSQSNGPKSYPTQAPYNPGYGRY